MGIDYLKNNYFSVFLTVAVLIYGLQSFGFPLPYPINNHLNDLLCMPLVLKTILIAVRFLKSSEKIHLPVASQVLVTLLFCIYFEWYLPKHTIRYTADWLDVIAYLLGFFLFNLLENDSINSRNRTPSFFGKRKR